jgi:hypothetical protein
MTTQLLRLLLFLALPIIPAIAQQYPDDVVAKVDAKYQTEASIPPFLAKRFAASGLSANYSIALDAINPFYLEGDFDGDGLPDFVTTLKPKKADARPENVVFLANGTERWLSQDTHRVYPGPSWYVVFRSEKISQSPFVDEEQKVPKLRGDAIMMVTPESSTALIFWNGKRFDIYWQAD